ncbi:MAG: hypothetical protein ACLRM8_03690 [Alistipes sp.]
MLVVVHCLFLAAGCLSPAVAPLLFPLPFGPDHGFCIRGIPACVSAGLLAVSFRSGSVGLPFLEKASAFRSLVAAPFLTK